MGNNRSAPVIPLEEANSHSNNTEANNNEHPQQQQLSPFVVVDEPFNDGPLRQERINRINVLKSNEIQGMSLKHLVKLLHQLQQYSIDKTRKIQEEVTIERNKKFLGLTHHQMTEYTIEEAADVIIDLQNFGQQYKEKAERFQAVAENTSRKNEKKRTMLKDLIAMSISLMVMIMVGSTSLVNETGKLIVNIIGGIIFTGFTFEFLYTIIPMIASEIRARFFRG